MKSAKLAICFTAFGLSLLSQMAVAQSTDANTNTPRLIAQGESWAKSGSWHKAKELFLQACAQDPSNVVALHDLAVSYAHTNQLNDAAECERKALAANETYVPSHIELAFILGRLEDKNGAREHLKRALELEPDNKMARKNLEAMNFGNFTHLRKKNEPAPQMTQAAVQPVESKTVAVTETPVSRALIGRGNTMFRQGKYDLSKRFFEQALENCPESTSARNSLAVVLGSTGDLEGQIKESRRVLGLEPKNTNALCNLAWALSQKGELTEALTSYQKALELNPGLREAEVGQGILLYRTGKVEAAMAILKEALRTHPDYANLQLALGAILQAEGKDEEAVPYLQEALKLSPNNQDAKGRLAAGYLASASFNKAGDLYKQLIEQKPANAEYRIGYGLALIKSGDLSGASQQFKKAAELDKNLAAPHACLSMLEELRGKLAEAEQEARLAQEKDPGSQFFKDSAERLAKSRKDSEM